MSHRRSAVPAMAAGLALAALLAAAAPSTAADPGFAAREARTAKAADWVVILLVEVTSPAPDPCAGDLLHVDITLTNAAQATSGPHPATIVAPLPGGTVLVPGSPTGDAGFDPSTGEVVWEGELPVNGAHSIGYDLELAPSLPPGIALVNRVYAGVGAGDIDTAVRARVCGADEIPREPSGPWLSSDELPGFEVKAILSSPDGSGVLGRTEERCIAESLCVGGALAGRPEVFVKMVGPRPNGFLWTQVSRFTPARVELWVRQTATGFLRYYALDALGPEEQPTGIQDRTAFLP